MSENVDQTDCPPFDDISAYLDGESSAETSNHVESCDACQRLLQSLRAVGGAVAKASQPPADLAQRILAACQEDSGEREPVPFWGRPLLRYAAALVLTAALALAVRTAIGRSGTDDGPGGMTVAEGQAGNVQYPNGSRQPGGAVDNGEDLVKVTASKKAGAGSLGATTGTRVLAGGIKHVWSVPAIDGVAPVLESQLGRADWTVAHQEQRRMTVRVTVTDERLQKLVQSMYNTGWKLFSDDLPQPNEAAKVKFSGRRVLYQADFVAETTPR